MRTAITLILASFFAISAHAAPPAQVVVFGDSLSDPGNAFALLGGTNTPPDYSVDALLIPDRPYAAGGHHFSNGDTWVEQLARTWRLAANANPAFGSKAPNALNFAIGGARAGVGGGGNLQVQVGAFLQRSGDVAPADVLYVIAIGGNDARAAAEAGLPDANDIIADGVGGIATQIAILYARGARNFLVWNSPDLGLTPALLALDQVFPGSAAGATFVADTFNFHLEGALLQLDGLPGIHITRFDVFTKLHEIVAQPEAFGLSNVTSACITPQSAPFHCPDPDKYFFWDGIHPTRAAHGIIAHEVAATLAP